MRWTMKVFFLGLALSLADSAFGQGPEYQKQESSVPILTGFTGFGTSFQPGEQHLLPTIAPILLVPVGNWLLFETEAEFEGDYAHMSGQGWDNSWDKGIEYIQADVFLNKYVTAVGGRFLTPFGIFNERLHPGWVRNVQTAPWITGFEMTDSNGIQGRGAASINRHLTINYAAYYSAASDTDWFLSDRQAGGRLGLFFPEARFEVGGTYQRKLIGVRRDLAGVDWTWQLKPIPLDIRGEFARDPLIGKGYWIEGAYRMRRVRFLRPFMRKSQADIRFEQFWVSPQIGMAGDMGGMDIPTNNASRFFAGWNYWVQKYVRLNFAYGREFNSVDGDHNIWTVGLTYRFAFPLGGDK